MPEHRPATRQLHESYYQRTQITKNICGMEVKVLE